MEQLIVNVRRMGNTAAETLRGMIRESMLPQSLISGLIALLLASYVPAEGIAPFGMGCVAAVWFAGISPYFACAGALAGHLIRGCWPYAVAVMLTSVGIAILERRLSLERIYRLLIVFAIEALTLCAYAAFARTPMLYAFGGACVSTLCAVVLGGGLRSGLQLAGRRALSDAELMTMAASAGLIVLCFGKLRILGQSPAVVFCGVCVLLSARRFGVASAAFAVALGAGRVPVCGGDMHFIAVLAAGALIASSLKVFGRGAMALGFAAINVMFTYFVRGTGLFSAFETGLACLIFLLLPSKLYMPKEEDDGVRTGSVSARGSALQYRVGDIACVLKELARVFGGSDGKMLGFISNALDRCIARQGATERFGVESASACKAKDGSLPSGDSFYVRTLENSALLCISDGMGSGREACRESREAAGMLCDLLTVGFDICAAAECVNRLLTKRSGSDMYATLDALLIDKADGSAKVLKLGAPPSYVLRGGRLFSLYDENLPVGIIPDAGHAVHTVKLMRSDVVIMMSDGVCDALGSGLFAALTDNLAECIDLNAAARGIMNAASQNGSGDDMTLILARIE